MRCVLPKRCLPKLIQISPVSLQITSNISAIINSVFDIKHIIESLGQIGIFAIYLGLFGIVFAETGLLFGFFLPGDSLLITAGLIASQGSINIVLLCIVLFAGAVIGDTVGYMFGHKVGKKLFQKEDSLLFHKNNLVHAKNFYDKHGGKTIIIARFMPLIRTFAPIVAGMADMRYSQFILYNVTGGFLWAVGLTLAGYYLGSIVPEKYFDLIVFLVIIVSVSPGFYHALKTKERRHQLFSVLYSVIKKK